MLLFLKQQQLRATTLLVAIGGGVLANTLNIPLAWTIGPLIATIIMNVLGGVIAPIPHGRNIGQFTIGLSLGLYFIPEVVAIIAAEWLLLLLGACGCIILSLGMAYLNRSTHPSKATVFFACMPGGASEMVNLGRKFDADPAFAASAHSLRVVLLVLIVPTTLGIFSQEEIRHLLTTPRTFDFWVIIRAVPCALLGVFIWQRLLKQPNPWVLGALFATAIITYLGNGYTQLPAPLQAAAQLLLAVSLAQPINRAFFHRSPRFLLHIMVTTLLSFILTFFLSVLLAQFFKQNYLILYLGMLPGGMSELSLTARALNLDVAIVTSIQALRFIIIMLLSQRIFQCIIRVIKYTHRQ